MAIVRVPIARNRGMWSGRVHECACTDRTLPRRSPRTVRASRAPPNSRKPPWQHFRTRPINPVCTAHRAAIGAPLTVRIVARNGLGRCVLATVRPLGQPSPTFDILDHLKPRNSPRLRIARRKPYLASMRSAADHCVDLRDIHAKTVHHPPRLNSERALTCSITAVAGM